YPERSVQDFFNGLAALGRDLLRRSHVFQTIESGANDVDRVGRAVALGQHVLDTGHFQHGAHGTAGDDAGTFGRRLHVHARRTVVGIDRVLQRGAVQLDLDHVAASRFQGFLDGLRHFTRLATTETDLALAVANYGQRGERHDAAAFYRLGDA